MRRLSIVSSAALTALAAVAAAHAQEGQGTVSVTSPPGPNDSKNPTDLVLTPIASGERTKNRLASSHEITVSRSGNDEKFKPIVTKEMVAGTQAMLKTGYIKKIRGAENPKFNLAKNGEEGHIIPDGSGISATTTPWRAATWPGTGTCRMAVAGHA